jgi:hypothetical protein
MANVSQIRPGIDQEALSYMLEFAEDHPEAFARLSRNLSRAQRPRHGAIAVIFAEFVPTLTERKETWR